MHELHSPSPKKNALTISPRVSVLWLQFSCHRLSPRNTCISEIFQSGVRRESRVNLRCDLSSLRSRLCFGSPFRVMDCGPFRPCSHVTDPLRAGCDLKCHTRWRSTYRNVLGRPILERGRCRSVACARTCLHGRDISSCNKGSFSGQSWFSCC